MIKTLGPLINFQFIFYYTIYMAATENLPYTLPLWAGENKHGVWICPKEK
jgi:hypothetical protein